jgi:hypothetical protein
LFLLITGIHRQFPAFRTANERSLGLQILNKPLQFRQLELPTTSGINRRK